MDKLLINDTGWRPQAILANDQTSRSNEVAVNYPKRINKVESAGKKKLTVAPYDVASKKIKKERSGKSLKSLNVEDLGIELRVDEEEEEEEEEEEFDEKEVKKVEDDFKQGHVVYGNGRAVTKLLNQINDLKGTQGVISSTVMDEICISPRKLYDVNKNYTRGELLGRGGIGEVHYVTDNVSKKAFVQKMIKKERFAKKEVQVLLNLQHEHITEFYGLIVNEVEISVFMSFAGISLETLILKNNMVFSEDEVIYFSIQALSALAYMDLYRMVHMDVKPQNICIKRETGHLYLTDFGSSLTPQQELDFSGVTPEYMSPELCQLFVNCFLQQQNKLPCYQIDRSHLNGKNDVYAWACTMCFVFLRNHAALNFIDKGNFSTFRYHFLFQVAKFPQLMSQCVPDTITADLKSVIVSMLNGTVEDRPNAEMGKYILEGVQDRRYKVNNEQTYQPLEIEDDKHASISSIKLKLKEKIEKKTRTEDSGPSSSKQPEIEPIVESTEDESSTATGAPNIPNFDSLF